MADERSINLVVKREYKVETREAEAAISALKNALADLNFYKFAKGEEELNREARELLNTFIELGRDVSKLDTSKIAELVKYMNALSARTGKSFTELFPDVSGIDDIVSKLRSAAAEINSTYSEAAFRESYVAFDLFAKHGLSAFDALSKLSGNSELFKGLQAEIRRVTDELEYQKDAAKDAREELAQFKADNNVDRFRELTSQATKEFKAFLLANNIDENISDGWTSVADLMEEVRNGAMTAGEAITILKRDLSDYLPKETTADLTGFATTLETILEKVEAIRSGSGGGDGGIDIVDNAEIDRDTESIRRESEAIGEITSQTRGIVDISTLLNALVEAGKQATGETSNIYESILPVVQAVKDLSDVDTSKLRSLSGIFEGFAGLNGFKISSQQTKNLSDLLSAIQNAGDLGNLTKLSGISLTGLSNIKVSKQSVDNFERLVPLLSTLAGINSSDIRSIAEIDYTKLDQIKVPEVSETSLSSIQRMDGALTAMKGTLSGLREELDLTGKAVTQNAQKMANAGLSHSDMSHVVKSGLGENGVSSANVSLRKAGLSREEADEMVRGLENVYAGIQSVEYKWRQFGDGAKEISGVIIKAVDETGKEVTHSLNWEQVMEKNADGVEEMTWRLTENGKVVVNYAKQTKEATRADAQAAKEIEAQSNAMWEAKRAIEAETEAIAADTLKQDEYIRKKREAEEAAEMSALKAGIKEGDDFYAEEDSRLELLSRARDAHEAESRRRREAEARQEAENELRIEQEKDSLLRDLGRARDNYEANERKRREAEARQEAAREVEIEQEKDRLLRDMIRARDNYEANERKRVEQAAPIAGSARESALTQIGTAQNKIRATVSRAESADLGSAASIQALRGVDAEYERLAEDVRNATISEADFRAEMARINQDAANANSAIGSQITEAERMRKTYDSLMETMSAARSEWDVLPDDEKAQLDSWIAGLDELRQQFADGAITRDEYAQGMDSLNARFKVLNDRVKEGSVNAHSFKQGTTEYYNSLIQTNSAISRGSKALQDYTAAEHSKNEASREGYTQIKNAVGGLQDLDRRIRAGTISTEEAEREQKKYNGEIEHGTAAIMANGDAHMTAFGKIGRAVKTHLTTLTATSIIGSVIREARQMVTTVTEIDTAMTELRKVTDETEARYTKFLDNAAVRAKNLSATISDTVTATADFARLGLSINQAEVAADAAIVYKAVGDDINTIDDAAQSIISTMKAFNIQAEDSMQIVDKFNEVGNRFAISSGGVGEALKRSASAMQAANNTLDETIGLATAANTILQNPQSVGTTLKTVSMYVRAAKTELEAAGEETDGIAESTGKLRELIMQITREGGKAVDIMSDDNTFKSTYQILEEISEVWDKLSDANQAALLEKLGGKRNANAIAAILENFDIAQQAMETAQSASEGVGSAMKELDKYQQSIEGHMVRFKTAYQELAQTLIDGDMVKQVIDLGTSLLGILTDVAKLVDELGGLKTAIIAISGFGLIDKIGKIIKQFNELDAVAGGLGGTLKGLASNVASAFTGPAGIMKAVTLTFTAISAVYSYIKSKHEKELADIISSGQRAADEANDIIDLYSQYANLNSQVETDADKKSELVEITDTLLNRLGIEKDAVAGLAGQYENLSDAINRITLDELYKKRAEIESKLLAEEEGVMGAYSGGLAGAANTLFTGVSANEIYASKDAFRAEIVQALKDAGFESYVTDTGKGILLDFGRVDDAYDVIEMYATIQNMMTTLSKNGLGDTSLFEKLSKRSSQLEKVVSDFSGSISELNTINDSISRIERNDVVEEKAQDNVEALEKEREAVQEHVDNLREYIDAYETLKQIEDEAAEAGYGDKSETIFGNIDTNNRQILEWMEDAIEQWRSVLESWGYTEEEIQEMLGSISTVMGTSGNWEGLEIAFSPILQTENGPVLLSSDAVDRYIGGLIDELRTRSGGWTSEDLLRLDTRGLEVDGVTVKNILASVGEDARRVGEVMHYAGSDGALAEALTDVKSAANKAGIPLSKVGDKISDVKEEAEKGEAEVAALTKRIEELGGAAEKVSGVDVSSDISEYKNKFKVLTDAWTEFTESGMIASETYQKLNKEFENESGLVEIVNGKLSLNAAAVEKLNEKLRDEYGLKIALAGASEEEIAMIDGLSASLETLGEAAEDPTSELKELTGVLSDMQEGVELSTFDTLNLIQKYPQLRDKIIQTANGYKIEESAIRDLIQAKSQLLTLNEREIGVTSARTALISSRGEKPAEMIDKIFADFEAANGKAITTVEEFAQGYFNQFGHTYEGVFAEYEAYVNAMIDLNNGLAVDASALAMIVSDLNSTVKEGYDPSKEKTSSSSSSTKEETAFEKAYKAHQHYLAMDQETVENYLNWLDGAYKASYAAGEMEIDDYYKYEEEVYEKRKELFQTNLDQMQHQIDLLSHKTTDTSAEQIAIYEKMQKELNAQANRYRARGIKDNDALIRELQNQWWQYEENIRQLREGAFNDWVSDRKFAIDQLKLNDAGADEIMSSWKEILVRINSELEYYANKGYDITTDVVQSLLGEMQSVKEAMIAALDEVVQKANEVVDGFENVYKTLTDAAKEYASTGYLSVDSLQAVLSLGPKYLDMLADESGQLVLNEDRLQKVIAARTEEMAAETALSYAKQVLLAVEQEDSKTLRELTQVEAASSAATWDMAYATLGYAKALGASKGMSSDYFDDAISYVTKMQSVTKTAVDSVSAYYASLKDGYVSQADGLETILKLTEDMIKQENSDRIDALEKEKDLYKDIIDEKKEILRLTKEQEDHDRDTADKLKEIADLQSRIDQLALDDSREAQAQRTKLEAELYEKQKALADNQADYAYEAQTEALDRQYEEFEKEKDDEIDALKDMLGSAEQLYQAAVDRIENGWDTLYEDLLNWNYKYGSTLQKDLTAAWKAAQDAAERYGSFVDAMEGVKDNTNLGAASTTPSSASVQAAVQAGSAQFTGARDIIDRMRANSIAWFTGDQAFLAGENQRLANDYKAATGKKLDYKNGLWYEEGSSTPIYNLAKDQAARNQIGNAVVAAMKSNSEAWKTADASQRPQIEQRNEDLAAKLANFLGIPITKTKAGVWMLGDTPLYNVTKFHTGGIAGGVRSIKQSEVLALLQKGEAVLDEKREQGLYKVVDFVQILSDKIGKAIDAGRITSILNGTAPIMQNFGTPALAGGIGTMNFSPTINVTIAGAGDLNESTARKYGSIAADKVLEQLKDAFGQRGVSNVGNGILK